MTDLIDRQAAIDALEGEISITGRANAEAVLGYANLVCDRIKRLPSADAAEVVRCRECRYWQDNNGGYPHNECRWGHDETPDADDYCSYGVQKDDQPK